ncbi:prevent-host-death protein [Methylobacterium sp. J-076]|uniref:prevent-host-death protein n=1 Tax=Methylobacterium sp. J-076 TaxID=2836655 RepID=UPI001FBAC695|nr:prevent-host-death protein [Methylobacterium sp. J-076]MCJ2014087.1 prevent-host-death protein [Methylobacterium sp. J-076]
MKRYSFSDMNRLSGEILETALSEPVALTKYGKERLVIIPADRYRSLTGRLPQTAFTLEDAPDTVHAELMEGLDSILADEPRNA